MLLKQLTDPIVILQTTLSLVVPLAGGLTRHGLVFLPQLAAAEFAEWLLPLPLLPRCLVQLLAEAVHFAAACETFLKHIRAPFALPATSTPRSLLWQVAGAGPQLVALIVTQSFG